MFWGRIHNLGGAIGLVNNTYGTDNCFSLINILPRVFNTIVLHVNDNIENCFFCKKVKMALLNDMIVLEIGV